MNKRLSKILVTTFFTVVMAAMMTFVASAASAAEARPATVTGNGVNLRAGASTAEKIYALLPKGTRTISLGKDPTGKWLKVYYAGMIGYASIDYFEVDEESLEEDFGTGKVTGDIVNMRKDANTSSDIIAQLSKDLVVNIVGMKDGWFIVEYRSYVGYISPDYLEPCVVVIEDNSSSGGSNSGPASSRSPRSSTATGAARALLDYASRFLGVPYVWGGASPKGFDCGGFTWYVFNNMGYSIPRMNQVTMGYKVSKSELRPGDLVFFSSSRKSGIAHVGIYAGDGLMIHAPTAGKNVCYSDITSGYYASHYITARRIIG